MTIINGARGRGKVLYSLSKLEDQIKKGETVLIVRKKHRTTNEKLAQIIFSEGKIIERKVYPERYSVVEAFGQRYRIENPEGKGVKITQLPNMSNS